MKWISVKEKLPELGERVLTLCKFGHIKDRMLYQFCDGEFVFKPDGLRPVKEITHWMYMPSLPENGARPGKGGSE